MNLVDAHSLASRLVVEHGLDGWRVEFDRAKRRAGQCRYADRVISLSAPMTRLHSEAEVLDTVLHEIAHALVGPQHGHDSVWRARAVSIGCSGDRCVDSDSPGVPGAWVGICSGGHTVERHRRPSRVITCSTCAPRFSLEHIFEWTYRGSPAPMHPNYLRELESLRRGTRPALIPVGARARVVVSGKYFGRVGKVVKIGRTRYHVELDGRSDGRRLTVPFVGVEPVGSGASAHTTSSVSRP